MPSMADVCSGSVPAPRVYAKGERWEDWIVDTPVFRALDLRLSDLDLIDLEHCEQETLDIACDLLDFLGDLGSCYTDAARERFLCLNLDGTRVAVLE